MEIFQDISLVGQVAIGLFIAIVFLQSSLDKIFDWRGNKSWLTEHFSGSPLAGLVAPMLVVITVVELAAGLLAAYGLICLLWSGDSSCLYYACLVSLAGLLMLLFGQRMAKDYDGARTITIYFGVILLGLLFF